MDLTTIAINNKICHHGNAIAGCLTEIISNILMLYEEESWSYPVWQIGNSFTSRITSRIRSAPKSELIAMITLILPGFYHQLIINSTVMTITNV
jgi:hypothetical protein